jgi:hypothetical protein
MQLRQDQWCLDEYELASLAPFLIVLLKLSGAILAWPRHLSTTTLSKRVKDDAIGVFVPYQHHDTLFSGDVFQPHRMLHSRSRATYTW